MIDKTGYMSEIDVMESLFATLGSARSDRKTEGGYDFRDVLASEMNSERDLPAPMEKQESSLPPSGKKPDRPKEEQQTRPGSEVATKQDSSQVKEETVAVSGKAKVEKSGQSNESNDGMEKVPADKCRNQAGAIGRDNSQIDTHQENKEFCITTVNTQTFAEKNDHEESDQTESDECVVDVLGIGPAGFSVAAQLVVNPDEVESAFGQNGQFPDQLPDSDGKQTQKTRIHGEPQRRLVRDASDVMTIADKADKTGEASEPDPFREVSEVADSNFHSFDLGESITESARRRRGASNVEPRSRKNVVPGEIENNGLSAIAGKRPTAEVATDNASFSSATRSANPSQILSSDGENRLSESIEQPKQDSNISIHNDDRFRAERMSMERPRDLSPTPHVSRFAEQAEHVVTIQRVAQAMRLAQERNGEIRLRLHPPELGALKLQMRVQEGVLTARLEVETPAAREVLLDNLPNLRERLAEHNIRVDNFDVALMQDGSGGQSGSREDFSGPRQPHWTRGTVPESPTPDNGREETGRIVPGRLANGQFDVVI